VGHSSRTFRHFLVFMPLQCRRVADKVLGIVNPECVILFQIANKLPRLRGYQLPANGPNQPRRMPKVYGVLDDAIQKYAEAQSEIATPDTGASGLEEHGFAERL
jgi:hypothetical protein